VTGADGLRLTADTGLTMALRIAPRYIKPGARESCEALVNDPVFLGSPTPRAAVARAAIMMYHWP